MPRETSRTVGCVDEVATASTAPPRVLVVGLDPYRVPGPWDPRPIAEAIKAATAEFGERGIDVRNCLVGLDGSDDVAAVVIEALVAQPWDCVLVGGGIRKAEELLELFERIVNLVGRHAPGASIAFNASPHDIVDAVLRVLASAGE